MGAACCVARRDKNTNHGSSAEFVHRNYRHSPTWSFRRDNRVGVVSEEASAGRVPDVASRNDTLDVKSTTDVSAQVSEGGSSMGSYQAGSGRKSSVTQATNKSMKTSASGQSVMMDTCTEVKQIAEASQVSQVSNASAIKLSPLSNTALSLSKSPLSSQSPLPPPSPSPIPSGLQLAHPASYSHQFVRNSPSNNSVSEEGQVPSGICATSNVSTRGSFGRSSGAWSTHAISDFTSASSRDQWLVDNDSSSVTHDKLIVTSGHNSPSVSVDLRTCGMCSKFLSGKSALGSQKIIGGAELSVVAVLVCGHVYHAECLENITTEINKYDPACPVCTLGEKQTLKLTGKMLKAEKGLKARSSKKSRIPFGDINASFGFETSSSVKTPGAKPFLKRHFSLGSRGKNSAESSAGGKKGLFWAKSSRV